MESQFTQILRHTFWNLVGIFVPLGAALFAIPFLMKHMGSERFGLLTLAWALVGYFTFFDLGLGRALTKLVSERVNSDNKDEIFTLTGTALMLMACLGIVGTFVTLCSLAFSDLWASKIPFDLRSEVYWSVLWIALSVPLVVLTAALRGLMEGYEAFRLANLIRVPIGIAAFLLPCLTVTISPSLSWALAGIALTRVAGLYAHVVLIRRYLGIEITHALRKFDSNWIERLVKFGGWLTVSNLVNPLLVYADRFVVASIISATAAGIYSTAFELMWRLLLLNAAFAGALFPVFSRLDTSRTRSQGLFQQSILFGGVIALSVSVSLFFLAKPLLSFWLGEDTAKQCVPIFQSLLFGYVLNAFAQIPYIRLQASGQVRSIALLHLIEVPLFIVVLIWMTTKYGALGAAWAWNGRIAVDCLCMLALNWLKDYNEINSIS